MRTPIALLPVLTAMGLALAPAAAEGAVVSGSDLSHPADSYTCVGQNGGCTLSIQDLPAATTAAGGAQAGIDGVIVSWSMRSLASPKTFPIRLHLIRAGKGVRVGAQQAMPLVAGLHSFPERLPVQAGDEIGVDFEAPNFIEPGVLRFNVPGASFDRWQPLLGASEERMPNENGKATYELMVNATIEPDADGDGFGDETQDTCASDRTTQGPCPSAPPGPPAPPTAAPQATAPETILGKRPAGTIHSRRVTFRFNANVAGSSFQCKLDRKPFKACASPKTYKGLAEGKHTFKVRAIGPTGLVDPTPGKRNFKVEL